MSCRRKTALTLICATLLFGTEAAVFWTQDWRYNLPTPRPAALVQAPAGTTLVLPPEVDKLRAAAPKRPVLLHFYNPSCPCSRFNLEHVRGLARRHSDRALVIAVLQIEPDDAHATERETERLGFPVIVDIEGKIAAACGVYSTPQAVVISAEGRLLYRGNYNSSRFCTSPATEFARLALEAAISERSIPQLPTVATTAYGCPLPTGSEK